MANDAPKAEPKTEDAPPKRMGDGPTNRLDALRAELKKLAPHVKVERVEAIPDAENAPGSKAHVKASWDRKRVSHVVEPPHSLDDAEIAVLSVVIAQFKVA